MLVGGTSNEHSGVVLKKSFGCINRCPGFSGAGCCNDKIAVIAANLALCLQAIQNLLLVWVGLNIENELHLACRIGLAVC